MLSRNRLLGRLAVAAVVVIGMGLVHGAGTGEALPTGARAHQLPPGLAHAIRVKLAGQRLSAASFNPVASLTPVSGSVGNFGASVAISSDGTTAVVGSPSEDGSAGAAYIFHSSTEGGWISHSLPTTRLTNGDQGSQDQVGRSVAISADGKTVIVGAPGVDGDVGAAYVFQAVSEASWSSPNELATLEDSASPGDGLGFSVALSADATTALIGAFPANDNAINATGAYVFHVSAASAWTSTSTPTATLSDGASTIDELGYAVSLSSDGTTALVGAPLADSGTGLGYVFHAGGEGSWASATSPVATLGNGDAGSDNFGGAVALSADGETAVAGAASAGATQEGAAYVFHVSAETSWATSSSPAATLTRPGADIDDFFGGSVAITADGTTILVGLGVPTSVNSGGGAAYVFHATSAASWTSSSSPAAALTDPTGLGQLGMAVALSPDGTIAASGSVNFTLDVFSSASESSWGSSSTPHAMLTGDAPLNAGVGGSVSVSADGTTALVGGTEPDERHGGAYVFHVTASTSWANSSSPTAILQIPGPTTVTSVAFSADGTTAFVASGGVSDHAVAYVFRASGEGSWKTTATPTATLSADSALCTDTAVAVSNDGTTAVLGCGDAAGGAAYVFHVATESAWSTTATPTATLTDGQTTDDFGNAVSLASDGTTLVVGARAADTAYVFHAAAESRWSSTSTPQATLDAVGFSGDSAGASVAISPDGTTALMGVPGVSNGKGAALVFHVPSATDWSGPTDPAATLANSAGFGGDEFGSSVALSSNGTSALVGSPSGGLREGVYLFQAPSEGAWATESLANPTLAGGGGSSVALTPDRSIALVGGDGASVYALPQEAETLSVSRAGTGPGTVTSAPAGIDCGSSCSHDFKYATSVTLTATAGAHSTFSGWSGACSGTGTCTTSMTQARSVTVQFTGDPETLSVSKAGTGKGTVTSAPAGIDCGSSCSPPFPYGTSVTLTAEAAPGSTFTGWSGACTGTRDCVFTVAAATAVTATFKLSPCVVPKVTGKTLAAAKRSLKSHHCSVGKIKHASSRRIKKGAVISQKPKPGTRLKHGAKVSLVVSKGR